MRESKMEPRVLVVDDDKDIAALIKYNLEKEGVNVKCITDSMKTMSSLEKFSPDLIILDIMMPGIDGIGLCRQIRKIDTFKDVPIFFLTARVEKYYETAALEVGGSEFIQKFLGLRSLVNKVLSVLKSEMVINKQVRQLRTGEVTIDLEYQGVIIKNRKIHLSERELELLYFLAQNQDKEVSEIHLLRNIWGSESYKASSGLPSAIENIRKKTGKRLIARVEGNKYRFNPRA